MGSWSQQRLTRILRKLFSPAKNITIQPRTQASSRYPSYRGGLEPSAIANFPDKLDGHWRVTSHPKSPRTTGNEAGGIVDVVYAVSFCILY